MKSVLIVDDSIVSRKMLAKLIESSGYSVASQAINGKEALELYKKLSPDVVTMDITMPEMNGIDALKMIREYDPQAKVVLITAAGQIEKKEQAMEYGATAFITKPYDNQDILDAIAKCLEE